ncbi:MAG: hypothetical protein ACF8QF_13020 [Phycisphaerales bacterium]
MDRDARMAAARDAELTRLRAWRVRGRNASAGALFRALGENLRRRERQGGAAGGAGGSASPPELLPRTRVEGLRAGVLTVLVDDAATRFALDRALRSGLENAVIRASAAPIRRVRLRLAP